MPNAKSYYGKLYPTSDMSKAVIVITGSDGGSKWANEIAQTLSSNGISSYSLAYWGKKGLSKTLSLIPIEIIQDAAAELKTQGYQKIGIYGVSKGAEFALTAASILPEIEFVIAVSPACCVFEGIAKKRYNGLSSWQWQGKPLPFADFDGVAVSIVKNLIKTHQFGFTPQYLSVLAHKKNEDNTIKVEKINGPILLLAAKEDAQWPSAKMSEMIVTRLKERQFPFPVQYEVFPQASHILCPVKTIARFAYRVERSKQAECNLSREKALRLTIDWLGKL